MVDFRFEDLEIWKDAIETSDLLFDYSDKAEKKKMYRFSEQLRAAGMSISNNIAEGSGSYSEKEFANYLNMSRRSVFECANIIQIFQRRSIITNEDKEIAYRQLLALSKKIHNFRKAIIR